MGGGGACYYSSITMSYSNVQGGIVDIHVEPGCTLDWHRGNIDADPCFVQLGYLESRPPPEPPQPPIPPPPPPPPGSPSTPLPPPPNNEYYTWVDGDYHLLSDSPCIDTGDPNYQYDPNEKDLAGRPRVMGGRIDMGAYEYMPSIPAETRIIPRTINLASKGNWITCYIWLPEDFDVANIDPYSVFLEGEIKPEQISVDEQKQVAIARFSREYLRGIISTGEVELTITGQLKDKILFEATDVIRVIDEGRRKN
jgi:hypothetical protein